MTIAATHRQGCRSGTASMAAGRGWRRVDVNSHRANSGDQLIAPLITGLSIMPGLDAPVRRDLLVVAGFDEVLERLLQRCASGEPFLTGQP